MATVNKIDIAGLEGNEAAQPRVFAHSAIAVALPAEPSGSDTFVYIIPNTGVAPTTGDTQTVQTRGACIYIGSIAGGSDLDVELEGGSRVTFKGLTAGSFLPILATKIYVTNSSENPTTTVSDILALFLNMKMGMGMPIPDLSNLPGVSRPGGGGTPGPTPLAQIDNLNSMEFDGANNLIDTGESILHTTSSTVFSVSAWININNLSTDMNNSLGAISADAPDGNPTSGGFWLAYDDRNTSVSPIEGISYNIKTSTGFQRGKSNNNVISSNTWAHIVLVLDGQATLYINGVNSTNRTEDSQGTLVTQSNELTIGGFDNFSFDYKGLIDEVAIFNTALTEAEILSIYNATAVVDGVNKTADLSQLTTPPVAWYRM